MLTVLVSRDSTDAVPGQGVLALRCATTGAGLSGHPCCCAEAVPHGPFVQAPGAVLGQGF